MSLSLLTLNHRNYYHDYRNYLRFTLVASTAYAACLKGNNVVLKSEVKRKDALIGELNHRIISKNNFIKTVCAAHDRYRAEAESLRVPQVTLGIKSIMFNAVLPGGGIHRTEFKLGLVPCGKTVEWLSWERGDVLCKLTQYHTDGSLKEFTYKVDEIVGREIVEKEAMELRRGTHVRNDIYKNRVKIDARQAFFSGYRPGNDHHG